MPKIKPQIANRLNLVREQAGVSAATLAEKIGVSRQTIYAIEKGTYIPNTVVGLRLARVLGVSVEQLFSLPEEALTEKPRRALLLEAEDLHVGQPVQLCDVDGHLIAVPSSPASSFLPPSDAIVSGGSRTQGSARVHVHEAEADFGQRLLLAGCDPAMAMLARYLEPAGIHAILSHQNSSQALSLLKRGHIHVAGTHLKEEAGDEFNVAVIRQHFPTTSVAAFSFAIWQEGLVVASGNPKGIKGVEDLARKQIKFLNREAGAGTRALLDRHLQRLHIDSNRVAGYQLTASSHLAAAGEVKRGAADCCMATQAAARFLGLDFIPLQTSRYDLVIRKQHLQLPAVQTLLDVITRLSFREELRRVGLYETSVSGARVL